MRNRPLVRSDPSRINEQPHDVIDSNVGAKKRPSLLDLAKEFCGSISGPKDMSTRKLKGCGQKIV
jgi:hypothetical protein